MTSNEKSCVLSICASTRLAAGLQDAASEYRRVLQHALAEGFTAEEFRDAVIETPWRDLHKVLRCMLDERRQQEALAHQGIDLRMAKTYAGPCEEWPAWWCPFPAERSVRPLSTLPPSFGAVHARWAPKPAPKLYAYQQAFMEEAARPLRLPPRVPKTF